MQKYSHSDAFDIVAGMTVQTSDGQPVGVVTEIAGFGATFGSPDSDGGTVRQAQSGTGFIKVRPEASSLVETEITFPFSALEGINAEGAVVLRPGTSTAIPAPRAAPSPAAETPKRGWLDRLMGRGNDK